MNDRSTQSLLSGRSSVALTEEVVKSVTRTFVGLDNSVPFEHDPQKPTRFVVNFDQVEKMDIGRVYFGSDIYPGTGVADPNSALSMKAAVAHEISHYHRWQDQTELPLASYRHLDEAMTSLDAALRFAKDLSAHEVQQLMRDALQRLGMHYGELTATAEPGHP
jgi:hypothetical protein